MRRERIDALVGTKGMLRLDPAYEYIGELTWTVRIDGGEKKRTFSASDQFRVRGLSIS